MKFLLRTFGCQMNKDDSERISGLMAQGGHVSTEQTSDADIIIFNTCCVRKNADERLYGQVGSLKQAKRDRPALILAVGGCLAQLEGERLLRRFPHVDLVFGTHNIADLPTMIEKVRSENERQCRLAEPNSEFAGDLPSARRHDWHAWLPIAVGCDNFCTYCIVPYVRGPEKSQSIEKLVRKADRLTTEGVKEITLLGQNVNSYGRDLYRKPMFAALLGEMASLPKLERLRFTTSHPKDLTDDIIETVASEPVLCPHFHLPLQSGSDRILDRMERGYKRAQYLEVAEKIRTNVKDVSITTDIMVGFPGETERDFRSTLEIVEQVEFDHAFTFVYSKRPGTAAADFTEPIDRETVSARFERLIKKQNQNSLKRNRRLVDTRMSVFVEGLSKKKPYRLQARTASNKLVHFDGPDNIIGEKMSVKISKAYSWFMIGEGASPLCP